MYKNKKIIKNLSNRQTHLLCEKIMSEYSKKYQYTYNFKRNLVPSRNKYIKKKRVP